VAESIVAGPTEKAMRGLLIMTRLKPAAALACAALMLVLTEPSIAQQQERSAQEKPAFVVIERTATTGSESIQEDYARLARDILPKYGGRYIARSRNNLLLEGQGTAPCCMALLEFPNVEAVRRWYNSPENREAVKIRDRGAKFRLIAIEGLAPEPH
jgi:uncharacterized protein (DUF1330 family)